MIWKRFKGFGLPFSGGWAEQPVVLLDIIEACENEYQKLMEPKNGNT